MLLRSGPVWKIAEQLGRELAVHKEFAHGTEIALWRSRPELRWSGAGYRRL